MSSTYYAGEITRVGNELQAKEEQIRLLRAKLENQTEAQQRAFVLCNAVEDEYDTYSTGTSAVGGKEPKSVTATRFKVRADGDLLNLKNHVGNTKSDLLYRIKTEIDRTYDELEQAGAAHGRLQNQLDDLRSSYNRAKERERQEARDREAEAAKTTTAGR